MKSASGAKSVARPVSAMGDEAMPAPTLNAAVR